MIKTAEWNMVFITAVLTLGLAAIKVAEWMLWMKDLIGKW